MLHKLGYPLMVLRTRLANCECELENTEAVVAHWAANGESISEGCHSMYVKRLARIAKLKKAIAILEANDA